MTTQPSVPQDDFLYGCFLDYRNSLNLERWMCGLLQIRRLLATGKLIREQIGDAAGGSACGLFPDLKPPGISEEDFAENRKRARRLEGLSEDERDAELEMAADQLREAIESGEFDFWDDTSQFLDPHEAQHFLDASTNLLTEKICPACNPNVSWLEKSTLEILRTLEGADSSLRGWEAILLCWDFARMQHEGAPPYKVVFSKQVEEFLGVDGKLESARFEKIRPLTLQQRKLFRAARHLAECLVPSETGPLQAMAKTCEIS